MDYRDNNNKIHYNVDDTLFFNKYHKRESEIKSPVITKGIAQLKNKYKDSILYLIVHENALNVKDHNLTNKLLQVNIKTPK
jgi:hypothetical protein